MEPNKYDHDNSLTVCRGYADQITTKERDCLSRVAGAYATNEPEAIEGDVMHSRKIVTRVSQNILDRAAVK